VIQLIGGLVTFLRHFHRHWLPDPVLDPALIPADLPPGLATIYRELGALVEIDPQGDGRAPFAAQDALVPLSRLRRVDGLIEFAWENQGNWSARCPPGEPDPPVYSNAPDLWHPERRGFVEVCPSLNHFLTTLCLQEAVMSCRNLLALRTGRRPPDQVLTVSLRPLWLAGIYVNGEPDHHFFVPADVDVLVMDLGGVWLGSTERGRALRELVAPGVDWQVIH
jgi:hypothetical protein